MFNAYSAVSSFKEVEPLIGGQLKKDMQIAHQNIQFFFFTIEIAVTSFSYAFISHILVERKLL